MVGWTQKSTGSNRIATLVENTDYMYKIDYHEWM